MNKIISAINSMILNSQKINNVVKSTTSNEFFFLYDNKYKWSISMNPDNEELYLHYYKTNLDINELASIYNWQDYDDIYTTFSTKELKTQEAKESFLELYKLINNRRFDLDDVLDDIINDSPF